MAQFRTILVAADFSKTSREAFRMACALAHPDETRLTVLHADEPVIVYGEMDVPVILPDEVQAHREASDKHLREFYVPPPPLQVEYRTRPGLAAEEILRSSNELGADLIVLGIHGRTGLRRLLTGSVAEVVLRHAHCPVLGLRFPAHFADMTGTSDVTPGAVDKAAAAEKPSPAVVPQEQEPATSPPTRTILCPTDFSDRSATAFRVACSLAQEHGARLIVIHAAPMATVYGGMIPGVAVDPKIYQHVLEERLRQLQIPGTGPKAETAARSTDAERSSGSETPHPEILVEHRTRQGDVEAEILQVADEVQADLIVMGTHGRTGLGRVLMGSVAESVLRGAHCPVLTVKHSLSETAPAAEERPASWVTIF